MREERGHDEESGGERESARGVKGITTEQAMEGGSEGCPGRGCLASALARHHDDVLRMCCCTCTICTPGDADCVRSSCTWAVATVKFTRALCYIG